MNASFEKHVPVMLNEVVQALDPKDKAIYVDGTFGRGGYTEALLKEKNCLVFGIDRDPEAVSHGKILEKKYHNRFKILDGCFGDMSSLLEKHNISKTDGIVLDLGFSSPQIEDANRGFSFQQDGPLDMRMSKKGKSAADVVNSYSEDDLHLIFKKYGEEKKSKLITRKIVEKRAEEEITTTFQLRSIIHSIINPKGKKIDPATKTFQALRIYVNQELEELEKALNSVPNLLKTGGKCAIVSFHSLEDRIVKKFFYKHAGQTPAPSRHQPPLSQEKKNAKIFALTPKKCIKPSQAEIEKNPRSRSAKLRVVTKIDAVYQSGGHNA